MESAMILCHSKLSMTDKKLAMKKKNNSNSKKVILLQVDIKSKKYSVMESLLKSSKLKILPHKINHLHASK